MKSKRKRNLAYWIGNVLLGASLIGFGIIFYPVAMEYLWPHQQHTHAISPDEAFAIEIEKLQIASRVIPNVDPWDQAEYQEALRSGIAHAKGTALPEEQGTVYLFAHSSDMPWRLTRYNTVFFRLHELEQGDMITVWRNGEAYRYRVRETQVVSPTAVQHLTETSRNQLILQTCTPIGTAINRLLVFADPV